jgi:metallo-beta-lactamase family protein
MKITPYGAAQMVTGSCHLVEHRGYQLLLDCGAYQGSDEDKNQEPFGFDPKTIDAVVVSHAHNDHIGRLPMLMRQGYKGKVYMTEPTSLFMPVILEDSLHLQIEERQRLERKGKAVPPLLWDDQDLKQLYAHVQQVGMHQTFECGPFEVRMRTAGHLPGSAFIQLMAAKKRLVFSGDLGNRHKDVLPDPDYPIRSDLMICEGTYGDRSHKSFADTLVEFAQVLNEALTNRGKVFIPTFALERTQEVLYYIRELEENRKIPSVPVYVDSPMASKISQIYPQVEEFFSPEVQHLYAHHRDPFAPRLLNYTYNVEDSKALNQMDGPLIILAGNGMLSGGRILHHLRHGLSGRENALIITGYQPRGGLGQILIGGAERIKLFGEDLRVRASVHTIGGFSGHAGQDELLNWLDSEPRIGLVHGETDKLSVLAKKLSEDGKQAMLAEWGQAIEV